MNKLRMIFNGNPDSGVGNIQRAGLSAAIPILMGLGGAAIQLLKTPEIGLIPALITMLVPATIGIIEMFRQFGIVDKKNKAIDDRTFDRLLDRFGKTDVHGLYKYKRRK